MRRSGFRTGLALLALFVLFAPLAAQQGLRDVGCSEWHACREMARAAADSGDYERFHDLAWRAIQLGPKNDPGLMALLAHAQALSGRPHDALVMLDRLAGMGIAADADSEDFARTRQLPGWSDVAAHIERVRRPDAAAPPATTPPSRTPASPPAATPPAPARPEPEPASAAHPAPSEAIRFSTGAFTPGGLAYDAVSGRFLFADRVGRKLFIVSERSNRTTDFVRGDTAGFNEIAAMEIDARRGDLWVASGAPAEGAGTVHKLQLISGRVLRSFPIAEDLKPVSLVDLAVTPAGAVLVLDATGSQLLELRPGAAALDRVIRLTTPPLASLAAGSDESIAYVAHRDGLVRIDLRARTAANVTAPRSVALDRLERIRWHDRALFAVRADEDGTRRIMRLDLNASGRAITKATTLEPAVPIAEPAFVTFWGDELVYLADGSSSGDGSAPGDGSRLSEFVAYRLPLR
ncbi:MAG TPA: hypothetical protein VKE51_10810 [Vicinamibacterales bacterium]|nr:hypothetical protein [Vicinamibacterales bacterium]